MGWGWVGGGRGLTSHVGMQSKAMMAVHLPADQWTSSYSTDWLETLTTEEDGGGGGVRGGWGGGLTFLVWMKAKAYLLPGFLNVLGTCRSMYAEIAVRVVKLYRHAMTVVRATTMR